MLRPHSVHSCRLTLGARLTLLALALLLAWSATSAWAAPPESDTGLSVFGKREEVKGSLRSRKVPRDRYQTWVLTYGPGDHPFSKFGHNALWVADHKTGVNRTFNFGTFEMRPTLISDFLEGRLYYWLSVHQLDAALLFYESQNRSAVAQLLHLDRAQEHRLVRRLEKNALPENRRYKYDYYQDNCSTRVRDLIDDTVHGRLHEAAQRPQEMTWREHTMRLAQGDPLLTLGLDLALGPKVDRQRSVWDEMFLPGVLQETLRQVRVGPRQLPLVVREQTLVQADRPPVAEQPPARYPKMLLGGCLAGMAVIYGGAGYGGRSKLARRGFSTAFYSIIGIWGLLAGTLGSLLVFFWTCTDHEIAYQNVNILVFPPWSLALPVLCLARYWWHPAERAIAFLCALSFGSTALSALLLLPTIPFQDNRQFVALGLPFWAALTIACFMRLREANDPGATRAPAP